MMVQLTDFFPGLPPLSLVTVIGLCLVISSLFLYMLSRIPELLLVTAIAFLYAAAPALSLLKHL